MRHLSNLVTSGNLEHYRCWSGQPLIRIVSLNICHGGGKRQSALAEWLIDTRADLLVLTEWRESSAVLGTELANAGYKQALALREGARANGAAVFFREEIVANRVTPSDAQRGELLLARTIGLSVLAAYFPQSKAKAPFFQRCAELAAKEAAPMLLMGDLNTGSNDRDIERGGARFQCEQEFIDLTLVHGLSDLWRKQHGDDAREWTWRSSKNGFRIDHAFANRAFLDAYPKATCQIDHSPREARISDHSALIVELRMPTEGKLPAG